jgi:hypothetical protein
VNARVNPASLNPNADDICPVFSDIYQIDFTPIVPTVTLKSTPNVNCAAAVPTGTVTATGNGPAVFSFEFFRGNANTLPGNSLGAPSASTTATNLASGFYTVQLTAGNGCTAQKSIFVSVDSAFVAGTLTTSPRTLCDPGFDGSVTITTVTETTASGNNTFAYPPATYSVVWLDSLSNPKADAILPPEETLENLKNDEYYAILSNDNTGCKTLPIFAQVEDGRRYPTVDLKSFAIPTTCLKIPILNPADPTINPATSQRYGHLTVKPTGSDAPFTFKWFNGKPKVGGVINTTDSLGGQTAPGFFTVEVASAKNCIATDSYELPIDKMPIVVSTSVDALANCASPDGRMSAIVTSAGVGSDGRYLEYNYDWYMETSLSPKDSTFFMSQPFINVAPADTFLLTVTDQLDATCKAFATVIVEDGRIFPVVTAGSLNPRTICDESNPDGIAFASVGSDVIDYSFKWYGNPIANPEFAIGPQVTNLTDSTYHVTAENIITHCTDTAQVVILFEPSQSPDPTIEILSQVTHCDPNDPNGALAVSVGGNTTDYLFKWYNGAVKKDSSDYYDQVIIDSLSANTYSVVAIDRTTLCESPLRSEILKYEPIFPDFKIDVEPTLCGLETGTIFLTITNAVEISVMDWYREGVFITSGPVVQNAASGEYQVFMTTASGCDTTAIVNVLNDINPYNGISRNGDQLNNYFHINCIEDFPANVVKIYNRAGTLVFEGKGYDNNATLFDGMSNKGISPLGKDLPDGTYFYIIDKHDGTKPIAGYLEIVN